jgi:predicted small secreted protein
MNRWKLGLPAAVVMCAVLLASCSDFFTTSWGKDLARDPGTITVTTKNVKSLLKESKGDTKASKGILDKIAAELKDNPNPDPALQTAAITAANQASGLSGLVLENIDTVLGDDIDDDVFTKLLDDIQETAKENDLAGIKTDVEDSLKTAVTTSSGKPEFKPEVVNGVSDAELAQLALTLILAESDGDFEGYIDHWGADKNLNGTGLTESEKIIAAVANELTKRGGELGGYISDMLE